ncbi:hypothetical protein WJX84_011647 [Apatococcus fuscideae]|uniref:Amidohydrolase-related domain-containing protein n=1 Tax=Apatococcus fuscideae TaxID=2026836 RepID=A0AAW1SP95_9CHLO
MAARIWTLYLFVAINVAALAIIASRFNKTPSQLWSSSGLHTPSGSTCGHLTTKAFVIYSDRVVLDSQIGPAAVVVRSGRIAEVRPLDPGTAASSIAAIKAEFRLQTALDYGSDVISPGLVDMHVHFNEPGREDWEGADFGSRAAAAGGVTTAIDMPLNQIPSITTGPLLQRKIAAIKDKLAVDMGMWGGLVPDNAGNAQVLQDMWNLGVLGFKSFMPPAGTDFGHMGPGDLVQAIPILQQLGAFFYVHAEMLHDVDLPANADARNFATWLAMRPRSFEQKAIKHLVELLQKADSNACQPGFHLHIAHLSDSTSLPMIRTAKQQGLPMSVETCPHYLTFSSEAVPDGDTRFKCAPPIREAANRNVLVAALLVSHS